MNLQNFECKQELSNYFQVEVILGNGDDNSAELRDNLQLNGLITSHSQGVAERTHLSKVFCALKVILKRHILTAIRNLSSKHKLRKLIWMLLKKVLLFAFAPKILFCKHCLLNEITKVNAKVLIITTYSVLY